MFVCWFIGLMGCVYIGIVHCQENGQILASIEPEPEKDVEVGLSIDDSPLQTVNNTNNFAGNEGLITTLITTRTTTQTPTPFACHECTNCKTKSDFVSRVCNMGITTCYKMEKRINKTSRIYRGCSTAKGHCAAPYDDQVNTFDTITCCTSHKCNQAMHFKPLFFLSITSLFTIFNI